VNLWALAYVLSWKGVLNSFWVCGFVLQAFVQLWGTVWCAFHFRSLRLGVFGSFSWNACFCSGGKVFSIW